MNATGRVRVGTVGDIIIFPSKGFSGVHLQKAECSSTGLRYSGFADRQWALMLEKTREHVMGSTIPKAWSIKTSLVGKNLKLSAPGMKDIRLSRKPKYTKGDLFQMELLGDYVDVLDCGDEVSEWLDDYLGKPRGTYRLVFHPMSEKHKSPVTGPLPWNSAARPTDEVLLQHHHPFHFVSTASVDDLNKRLAEKYADPPVIQPTNFRPNVVIKCDAPYSEDTWKNVWIGGRAEFLRVRKKERCPQVACYMDAGRRFPNNEPLRTMNQYRPMIQEFRQGHHKSPVRPAFGIQLLLEKEGTIKVGDPVFATLQDPFDEGHEYMKL